MFKLLTLSCLLAASAHCKPAQTPAAPAPYYPQPYPAVYPHVYPKVYAAQPKYNTQPAYVAVAPYSPGSYRQVYAPANPAFNPYYYGYAPYPAYPQQYPYPYSYIQNDGAQGPAPAQGGGWGEYFGSFFNYVPNVPSFTSENQAVPESETQGATGSSENSVETGSTVEASNPTKGEKPIEGQKAEQAPASDEQSAQAPTKQFSTSPFVYFGQPQYYGQTPYQQPIYDPSKLNGANNGAVSSFLFYRNQPQPDIFQQPQPLADQKYYQAPAPQSNQGTAALAYQKYLQYQKQQQEGQYQQTQFQQDQFQQQQQQQQQQDQQQQTSFQPQQQQYDPQPQQDESSVVVDSNTTGVQVETEGQQQAQSKLATGPTIAVAQPDGIAFAGIGGRAGAAPIGTAIVGKNSTAIAGPKATAISVDQTPTISLTPVHKLTSAYVAKYAPELGVYKVAEIKTS